MGERRSVANRAWRVVVPFIAVVVLFGAACSKSSSGPPLTTVSAQKFRYHGMPTTLKSGIHQFLFENRESLAITHEMIPIALPAGKVAQDVINDAKGPADVTPGAASEDEWLHIGGDFGAADTGASVVETLYLPPGTYAIACWQTGNLGGEGEGDAHAGRGMVFQFTVTG
jgi:hypothetical protein